MSLRDMMRLCSRTLWAAYSLSRVLTIGRISANEELVSMSFGTNMPKFVLCYNKETP